MSEVKIARFVDMAACKSIFSDYSTFVLRSSKYYRRHYETGRGDKHDPYYQQLGDYAWYYENTFKKRGERYAHAVGQKKANPWGLYDMHGNISEWCQDGYDENYYDKKEGLNPRGPKADVSRVLCRGGNWISNSVACRSAARGMSPPFVRNVSYGFRVVISLD